MLNFFKSGREKDYKAEKVMTRSNPNSKLSSRRVQLGATVVGFLLWDKAKDKSKVRHRQAGRCDQSYFYYSYLPPPKKKRREEGIFILSPKKK